MRNRSGIAPSEILNQSSNVQRQLAVHNDETVVDVFRIAETEINSPPVLLIEQMVRLLRWIVRLVANQSNFDRLLGYFQEIEHFRAKVSVDNVE